MAWMIPTKLTLMGFLVSLFLLLLVPYAYGSAPSGPWDAFNFAPESRVAYPRHVREVHGNVSDPSGVLSNGTVSLSGNGSYISLDFGLEVGGLISLNFDSVSETLSIALSFSESPLFVSPFTSDDTFGVYPNITHDGVIHVAAPLPTGYWTQPTAQLRGGFRFLTLSLTSDGSVTMSNVSCYLNFMPHFESLRDYSGYFHTLDPGFVDENFLTRLWYSGAYTVQLGTIAPNTGHDWYFIPPGWANNASLRVDGPALVDGAKRDRCIWPGDLGISLSTQFVSTNDVISTRNALDALYAEQASSGKLPYVGPPLQLADISFLSSDTYHAWTLVVTYNYVLYSGNLDWLQGVWRNYTRAVEYLAEKVDGSGLLNVTGLSDWGRIGQGGHNSEANALYYKVLTSGAELANWVNETTLTAEYTANASVLKRAYNDALWLPDRRMYRDNETTTLCAQDGNSLAIVFNLTESMEQAAAVSDGLTENWGTYGATTPERPDTISPFISGFEVQAHFIAGKDVRALNLMHREWGYMLYTPISVQSTLLEGYTSNGSLYYGDDPSLTSHAHGWSTGPTSALSFYVLGLQLTSPKGQQWSLTPHTAGLPFAEGGYATPLGWYGVKWASGDGEWNATISTPEGTSGTLRPPINGTVTVDGQVIGLDASEAIDLDGGKHTIVVQAV